MNISEVNAKIEEELQRSDPFDNSHGITHANLRRFLVEPYEAAVDPDDLESATRKMWIVLHERPSSPHEGYVVAYDPICATWAVAERGSTVDFVQVVAAETLATALEAM